MKRGCALERTEKKFVDIHTDILKHLGKSTSADNAPKPQSIFSNLPPGILPKLRKIRHRLTRRIRNYLSGNFSLHRGWTILIVILYLAFLIVLLSFRVTISFLG